MKLQYTPRSFKKYGNVILNWKLNTGYAFAGIIRAFIPPPAVIVDLCAGKRRLYRKLNNGNMLDGRYKFIFGDIRDFKGLDYVCDMRNPPKELFNIADGYVFDPPYPSTSGSLNEMVKKYYPLPKKEFEPFLQEAFKSIEKILKNKGILIIKISHPYNHIIYNLLIDKYKWLRDIVHVSICQGVFLVSYFMIFQKIDNYGGM